MKRFFAILLAAVLCWAASSAEGAGPWQLTDAGLDLPGGSVRYPKLTGPADEETLAALNAQITDGAHIMEALDRLMLQSAEHPLRVTWRASDTALSGGVLSAAFAAEGPVYDSRPTHEWRTVNIDLTTGAAITPDGLFTDTQAAQALLEDIVSGVQSSLSPMLAACELLPLPASFALDASGLTLYWPIAQYCTLADRAGSLRIRWSELESVLRTDEGSVPVRIGAAASVTLTDRETIEAAVAGGALPGIPAVLGASVQEAVDTYRLAEDPDLYDGGRMFALQDGAFRETWLLSDAVGSGWAESEILGIRSDCIDLCGLCTGRTAAAEWRAVLGEPDHTVALDADAADAARTVPGESDYYDLGTCRLRLHADGSGILAGIWLLR